MTDLIAEIYASGTVTDAEGRRLPLHSNLPELEGRILRDWVADARPRRLLEIGLAYGLSALQIGAALGDRPVERYHVIDPHQHDEWQGVGLANLARAGMAERITFHAERSEFCLPRLAEAGERLDFAFVDGWHAFDQIALELYYVNRMLVPGGIVVLDDLQLGSVARACRHLVAHGCYAPVAIPDSAARSTQLKVRRMMKLPPSRIAAFRKTAEDRRGPDWDPAEAEA